MNRKEQISGLHKILLQINLFVIIVSAQAVYIQNGFTQKPVEMTILPYTNIETMLRLPEPEDFTTLPVVAGENNTAILDSVYELKKNGYSNEYYHWYYHYSGNYSLDSVKGYFFLEAGKTLYKTETRYYNSSGNLVKLFCYYNQNIIFSGGGWGDSEFYYSEEYNYKDNKLIWKKSTKRSIPNYIDIPGFSEFEDPYSNVAVKEYIEENFYLYDELGNLVRDSLFYYYLNDNEYDWGSFEVHYYFYNKENKLQYDIIKRNKEDPENWVFYYTYETKDSAILVHEKNGIAYTRRTDTTYISSNTIWEKDNYYFETYDEKGRRTSLNVTGSDHFYSSDFDQWFSGDPYYKFNGCMIYMEYRFEFSYTDNDLLQNIVYYFMDNESSQDTLLKKVMYINYTYDENDNIILYEKTTFDERLNEWDIENKKEYYYTYSTSPAVENSGLQNISLYPNPAGDYLYIKNTFETNSVYIKNTFRTNSVYSIYNQCGMLVSKGRVENGIIPVSNFKPGIYMIILKMNTGLYKSKFVKY